MLIYALKTTNCRWFETPWRSCDVTVMNRFEQCLVAWSTPTILLKQLLIFAGKIDYYNNVIMSGTASQITGVQIVCSTICSGADQRKHENSAYVRGIHRWPVDFPHKGPVTRKMFLFDDSIWMKIHLFFICRGSTNIYLHFMSFPHIDMTQVLKSFFK